MKIVNEVNGVATNAATTNFNIEMNNKAFKALFSDIYTEKIAAVVREVGSNCADAHKMAGKEALPFKIKIHKDEFNGSYIHFIDYGVGMTKHQIENLYTSFFSSNKDTNNDCIGGFGIGSKSPLAYTDKFITESVKDGLKNVALIVSVNGQPQYNLIMEDVPTTEENGTVVKIGIDTKDVESFVTEAYQQFRTFKPFPVIEHNLENFKHDIDVYFNPLYEDEDIMILFTSSAYYKNDIYVSVDGITYKYSIGNSVSILSNMFMNVIKVKTGDVEVSLSRETIVRNDETTKFLVNLVQEKSKWFENKLATDEDFFNLFGIKKVFQIVKCYDNVLNWQCADNFENIVNKINDYFMIPKGQNKFSDFYYAINANNTLSRSFISYNSKEFNSYRNKITSCAETIGKYINIDDKDKTTVLFKINKDLKNPQGSASNLHSKIKRLKIDATILYFLDDGINEDYEIIKSFLVKTGLKYKETCYNNYRKDLGIIKEVRANKDGKSSKRKIPLSHLDVHCIGVNGFHTCGDSLPDSRYVDLSTFTKDDICVITEKDVYDNRNYSYIIRLMYELFRSSNTENKFFFGAFTTSKYDIASSCGYEQNITLARGYKSSVIHMFDKILKTLETDVINTIKHIAIEKFFNIAYDDSRYNYGKIYAIYADSFSYDLRISAHSHKYYEFIKSKLREINEECKKDLNEDILKDKNNENHYCDMGVHLLTEVLKDIVYKEIPMVTNIGKLVDDYIEKEIK